MRLCEASEALYKTKDPKIIQGLIDDGHLDSRVTPLINMFSFCETFHCLPGDLEKITPFQYASFCSIMSGRQKAEENEVGSKPKI